MLSPSRLVPVRKSLSTPKTICADFAYRLLLKELVQLPPVISALPFLYLIKLSHSLGSSRTSSRSVVNSFFNFFPLRDCLVPPPSLSVESGHLLSGSALIFFMSMPSLIRLVYCVFFASSFPFLALFLFF